MSAVLERAIPQTSSSGGSVKPHLISVAEYDRMIEAGIYTENDRIELLNGEIIELMPKGTKHSVSNDAAADLFREKLGARVYVRSQNPIVLDDFSEPEPDIVLAKPPRQNYLEKHPTPEDIYLVMEISDSTLVYDREAKARAYARGGIAQYLLLNLRDETVEDYRQPSADGYGAKQTHQRGAAFDLAAFHDIRISVADLF